MSTDQYPEVSSEDSGLVPQNAPKPEWPKKIRTLTAAELDRLTIDGDGRFYWDGHLVNYQPPQALQPTPVEPAQPSTPVDLDALALLDRAARELSGRPHDDTTATAVAAPQVVHETSPDVQPTDAPVVAVTTLAPVAAVPQIAPALDVPYRAVPVEKLRLRMSFWQTLGLAVVILALLVGATGIAVSGFVAVHEWGCRTKLLQQYCPPPPPEPKPPARFDIPA